MAYALITGASSGIGRHLAHALAARGLDVLLVARDEAALQTLQAELRATSAVAVTIIACDLSQPQAAVALYAQVRATMPVPEVLINNAGFGAYGDFHAGDAAVIERMVQVNIMALTQLMRLVLAEMRSRGQGRIMNVASCAGFSAGPLMAVYFATKAYVLHLSEAVAQECAGSGVTITALCPGSTITKFHSVAGFPEDSWLFTPPIAASSMAVAGYAVRALYAGKRVAIPGLANKLAIVGLRLIPRRLAVALTQRVLRH